MSSTKFLSWFSGQLDAYRRAEPPQARAKRLRREAAQAGAQLASLSARYGEAKQAISDLEQGIYVEGPPGRREQAGSTFVGEQTANLAMALMAVEAARARNNKEMQELLARQPSGLSRVFGPPSRAWLRRRDDLTTVQRSLDRNYATIRRSHDLAAWSLENSPLLLQEKRVFVETAVREHFYAVAERLQSELMKAEANFIAVTALAAAAQGEVLSGSDDGTTATRPALQDATLSDHDGEDPSQEVASTLDLRHC